MKPCVAIKKLNVTYPHFELHLADLSLPAGCIVGLVGGNGAGKTTTLKSILGMVPEAEGQIEVFGQLMTELTVTYKQKIAAVFDDAFFTDTITAEQISQVMALLYPNWQWDYFTEKIQAAGIEKTQSFAKLSKGRKMKMKVYNALACQPDLLLLDEPTSGLDPVARRSLLQELQTYLEGDQCSIIFSSHITTDIEKIADYVLFMHQGEQALLVEMDQFSNQYGIVKVTQSELACLGDFPAIYRQATTYAKHYLIDNRPYFKREYPDIICEPATIEETLLLIEQGERL